MKQYKRSRCRRWRTTEDEKQHQQQQKQQQQQQQQHQQQQRQQQQQKQQLQKIYQLLLTQFWSYFKCVCVCKEWGVALYQDSNWLAPLFSSFPSNNCILPITPIPPLPPPQQLVTRSDQLQGESYWLIKALVVIQPKNHVQNEQVQKLSCMLIVTNHPVCWYL